jgi:hypothetical protein
VGTAARHSTATLILITALLRRGDVRAQVPCSDLTIHLTFRGGFSATTQKAAARETARIWRPYGVDVTLDAAAISDDCTLDVPVFVMRDADGDVSSTALASVRFSDGEPEPIVLVYHSRLTAIIARGSLGGATSDEWPVVLREAVIARVLGRVIAHELGHILLRSTQHARTGLMRSMQPVQDLITPDFRFGLSTDDAARVSSRATGILLAARTHTSIASNVQTIR